MKKQLLTLLIALMASSGLMSAANGIGKFSVSATQQVTFSPGNLQYNAALGTHQCADGKTLQGTWRFAEHQWDYVGEDNKNISSTYEGWIDLFGFGTSGWDSGATEYQPWSTSQTNSDYYPGGSYENDLTGNYANADWGVYNQIGNDAPGTWRTLTCDEWVYLFHDRSNAENLFGLGKVNGVPGAIILPDGWQAPSGVTFIASAENGLSWQGSGYYQSGSNHYNDNAFVSGPSGTWDAMATSGAVFLPASGTRFITAYSNNTTSFGLYWSSSTTSYGTRAYYLDFNTSQVYLRHNYDERSWGFAVRLVSDLTTSSDPEPCILASGTCGAKGDGTHLTWELTCEGVLTVSGTGAMADYDYSEETRAPWYDSYRTKIVTVVIEEGITSIGDYAFNDCENLTAITIPNTVTSIGESAFHHCLSLGDINVPRSVSLIKRGAFRHCPEINISVDEDNQYYTIENGVLFNKEKTLLHTYPMSKHEATYSIPNTVTAIEDLAFYYADITSVDIPEGVLSIGVMSFYVCYKLTSITIPNSVTTIGGEAFYSAQQAKFLHLGQGLTGIGQRAFCDMRVIEYIISEAPTPPVLLDNDAFVSVDKSIPLYVPCEAKEAYKEADGWKEFTNVQAIPSQEPCGPCLLASGTCGAKGDNLTWELSCEGVLTVSGTGAMADWNGIATPWEDYKQQITTVILPDGITKIGLAAFKNCTNLTAINIPEGVKGIESNTFNGCTSLENIVLPQSVSFIRSYAFYNCASLTNINIPDNVTVIGNHAFRKCTGLTAIAIPDKVTSINKCAFYDCSALTTLTLGSGLTEIQEEAFRNCTSLTDVTIPATVTAIGDFAFYRCSSIASLVIENSAAEIGKGAFYECAAMTTAVLGDRITGIGVEAFYGCTVLFSVDIPATVTALGDYAFRNCSAMTSATFRTVTPPAIGKAAFFETPCTFYVPCGSKDAYKEALNVNTERVEEKIIPFVYSVTSSDETQGTVTLTQEPVSCDDLTLAFQADAAEGWQFKQWSDGNTDNPRTLTLTQDITLTAEFESAACETVASGTCGDNLTWELDCHGVLTISGTGAMDKWKTYSYVPWKDYAASITSVILPDGLTNIGLGAFYGCTGLTAIEIPNSVTAIGYQAFHDCYSLASVAMSSNVTSIGEYAFKNCSALTAIDIPEGVTAIEKQAFFSCSRLTSVVIPNSAQYIGDLAFFNCADLATVTFGENIGEVRYQAFYGCISLTDAHLPNSVTAIGEQAFSGCTALKTVTMSDNVTSIGAKTFYKCNNLVSVALSRGLTEIADATFFNCEALKDVTVPATVTAIGESAFQYCAALASVTIPKGVTTVGKYAFHGCTNMTSATFKCAVPEFGSAPFGGGNNCMFYVPCGSKEAYMAALNVKEDRVEETILPDYSVTSTDLTQGSVTVTHAPANCDDLTLSFRADASKSYEFVSWSDGNTDNPRSLTLTQDTVLTAVFAPIAQCSIETTDGITIDEDDLPYMWESKIFDEAGTQTATLKSIDGCDSVVTFTLRVRYHNIVLQENESSEYYDHFAEDYNGYKVTTATLNRQFTQGKWATLCLPFNVSKGLMIALGLYGSVYEFSYAAMGGTDELESYFVRATRIEAGKGYVVNANAKLAAKSSLTFVNITVNTDADTGDITTLTGYNDNSGRGSIYMVGTLRTGVLTGSTNGNTYIGLKNNMLYYPNTTSGTPVRAYRGVFRSETPLNAQRIRIVTEGETVAELQVTGDGQLQNSDTPARKYIDNGILYIERNGIRYTAQGRRID
ncbi:MAG: leucine-rich repeat protein [Paludibacteraceae bacterium]|nr:leucine-rich repeat protein [Paludibacteraceae bacterium]